MNDITIALLGGLAGSVLVSIISLIIFNKQSRKESNRHFIKPMLDTIQNIYLASQKNSKVPDEDLNYLISFKVVGLKQFKNFRNEINEIQKLIISYNTGVDETLSKTETSSLQISSKSELDEKLFKTIEELYKLT